MPRGSSNSATETLPLPPKSRLSRLQKHFRWPQPKFEQVVHLIAGAGAVVMAIATATNPLWVQVAERNVQSAFQQMRGQKPVPNNIVIVEVDEQSISLLGAWPLRREIYAQALDRIMQAGAKAIAVDVIWDLPSSYGSGQGAPEDCLDPTTYPASADDRALQKVLQRYDGRIALATHFLPKTNVWNQYQLSLPSCPFRTPQATFGIVNVLFEPEGIDPSQQRVYRLGDAFINTKIRPDFDQNEILDVTGALSFPQAALKVAGLTQKPHAGDTLSFYGPPGVPFQDQTLSFSYVLSPENWSDRLQNGQVFKDKLVVIGSALENPPDFVQTPVGRMKGVEYQATAIANLMQGVTLKEALPNTWAQGAVTFGLVLVGILLQGRSQRAIVRLTIGSFSILAWLSISYALMSGALLLVPTALPVWGMIWVGGTYGIAGIIGDRRTQDRLRQTLKRYGASPVVQEIIDQQEDSKIRNLLHERQLELQGKKLGGRYKVIQILGSGGFGETYVAEDTQRPGTPRCVVKQLHPTSDNPRHLRLARRLFKREAEALEQLGSHDQIPRLLAYFEEENEFYLVQEMVIGRPLSEEFALGRHFPETKVVSMVRELLQILSFVHQHGVIHRDIKPSNIIQRESDSKLVLIDFGAAKAIQTGLPLDDKASDLTVGIGTQGYMPPEQCTGNPRLNSDLYAVGMLAIQALTGRPPSQLKAHPVTGEVDWLDYSYVSNQFAAVLAKLVRYDFQARYQTAQDALQDLRQLATFPTAPALVEKAVQEATTVTSEEINSDTRIWPQNFGAAQEIPPTDPQSLKVTDAPPREPEQSDAMQETPPTDPPYA
ncbi:serine/threonine-protein kinase [Alkalinema sp. FACHB-956]|uniref:serine/threonine-protein kinase n=1 Tax=Alkalinema sp. FACHB-956 TaxID=2692768 RepID=UPI001689CCF3|nr:serine/threonine-protein kinase [Alkalinema sp. FACHB-956]MBD2329564.1 CHASE2 domain-containing protein [Alkalinema sp. FACHB-956]